MSSTTISSKTNISREHPSRNVVSRVRRYAELRHAKAQAGRELDSVLAGRHGHTMREEILAVLNR